jgi:hypothetical protein
MSRSFLPLAMSMTDSVPEASLLTSPVRPSGSTAAPYG